MAASAKKTSFKVYIIKSKYDSKRGQIEIVEHTKMFEDDSSGMTFDKFTAKLRQVFPQLQNSNNRAKLLFDLYWTDYEGDNITIASDEDLTIALREMKTLRTSKIPTHIVIHTMTLMTDPFVICGKGDCKKACPIFAYVYIFKGISADSGCTCTKKHALLTLFVK